MTQQELDRAVAKATSEDLREIRRLGFSIADPHQADYDPEPPRKSRYINWDRLEARRRSPVC